MEIVLNPDPEDDKVNAAVSQAIARAGVAAPSEPDAYSSAWRRAALARDDPDDRDPGYARPRSSRGATRA